MVAREADANLTLRQSRQMTFTAADSASITLSSSGCPFSAIIDSNRVRAREAGTEKRNQSIKKSKANSMLGLCH